MTVEVTPLLPIFLNQMRTNRNLRMQLLPILPDAPNPEDQDAVRQYALGLFNHPFESMNFTCDTTKIELNTVELCLRSELKNSSYLDRLKEVVEERFQGCSLKINPDTNTPIAISIPPHKVLQVIDNLADNEELPYTSVPYDTEDHFQYPPAPIYPMKQLLMDVNQEFQKHLTYATIRQDAITPMQEIHLRETVNDSLEDLLKAFKGDVLLLKQAILNRSVHIANRDKNPNYIAFANDTKGSIQSALLERFIYEINLATGEDLTTYMSENPNEIEKIMIDLSKQDIIPQHKEGESAQEAAEVESIFDCLNQVAKVFGSTAEFEQILLSRFAPNRPGIPEAPFLPSSEKIQEFIYALIDTIANKKAKEALAKKKAEEALAAQKPDTEESSSKKPKAE